MHSQSSTQTYACAPQFPRLGQISFVNALPVVLPLEKGRVGIQAETMLANPSQLNRAFAAGLLDVGAMSSFFYLSQPNFQLLPGLSIACKGPVGSVLFFCKTELNDLQQRRVALISSSATSIALLNLMLRETVGLSCQFVVQAKPDLDDPSIDGALVIGDQALLVDQAWSAKFRRFDLGQWWHLHTGLPMVFGVWAARYDWAAGNQRSFEDIGCALVESVRIGLSDMFPEVLAEAAIRTGLAADRLTTYYSQELNYELTPRHLEGLELFRRLCTKHGLLS